jgi:hypothetical protein
MRIGNWPFHRGRWLADDANRAGEHISCVPRIARIRRGHSNRGCSAHRRTVSGARSVIHYPDADEESRRGDEQQQASVDVHGRKSWLAHCCQLFAGEDGASGPCLPAQSVCPTTSVRLSLSNIGFLKMGVLGNMRRVLNVSGVRLNNRTHESTSAPARPRLAQFHQAPAQRRFDAAECRVCI